MKEHLNDSLKGDRPLTVGDEDKLGFREVAARIAKSLVDPASKDGLVVGIEGSWGSGKSSLLYLTTEEIENFSKENKVSVVDFRPWLIGNRDALISILLGKLAVEIDNVARKEGGQKRGQFAKATSEKIRRYLRLLISAGSIVEVFGQASGYIPITWVGKFLNSIKSFLKIKDEPPKKIEEIRLELEGDLRNLGQRFVVTIDDVDRLEPVEALEVLRLVRSVADLPNVCYLLCYDSETLAHSVEEAAGVKDGSAFLEKIVQLTVMVPQPETFVLKQWFTDELQLFAAPKTEDERRRLQEVVNCEGGRQFQTARSVVRALDSLRFNWPAIRDEKLDLADFVWLQLVKNGCPSLYRWIEVYCATMSAISLGTACVEDAENKKEIEKFIYLSGISKYTEFEYKILLMGILPGFYFFLDGDDSEIKIFHKISDSEKNRSIRDKRLSSADHYRLYFALNSPSHALREEDFREFRSAVTMSACHTATLLLRLHKEAAVGSLSKADILLERILGETDISLSDKQSENLLRAFSEIMDQAFSTKRFEPFEVNSIWGRAQELLPMLLNKLGQECRISVVEEMFRTGKAIGWLTDVFRREIFSHGHYGDKREPESNWIFCEEEFNKILALMLCRFQSMAAEEVFGSPHPLNLLYTWLQAGDEVGARKLVETKVVSDEGFIDVLEKFSQTVQSSEGARVIIDRDVLSPFLDFEKSKCRIEELAKSGELESVAKKISAMFQDRRR